MDSREQYRLSLTEYLQVWQPRQRRVFNLDLVLRRPPLFSEPEAFFPPAWTDVVFQAGFEFTFIDFVSRYRRWYEPFDEREDYARFQCFLASIGETEFVKAYHPYFLGTIDGTTWDIAGAMAGLFPVDLAWEEAAGHNLSVNLPALAVDDATCGDSYLFGPLPTWGLYYSDDGGILIAGTRGSETTEAFRSAFDVEGSGWTARLASTFDPALAATIRAEWGLGQ